MIVKEIRSFDINEFKFLIEKNNFYDNNRTDKNIKKILTFASKHKPTTKNLYIIACDIYENTLHDYYEKENITDLMKFLLDTCVTINYKYEDGV